MFSSLDASNFVGSIPFYEKQFEDILKKITACFQLMKNNHINLVNDENSIRDVILINYLKDNQVRKDIGLLQWHFEREIQENLSVGRTDIKVISLNTFIQQEAYYIIECKRINGTNVNGKTGLNAEYIKNGIGRFTSNYYSSYCRVNGMIGFVVDTLDIHENISNINALLVGSFISIETVNKLINTYFIQNFEYQYYSIHKTVEDIEIKIYHLMFDFAENIIN